MNCCDGKLFYAFFESLTHSRQLFQSFNQFRNFLWIDYFGIDNQFSFVCFYDIITGKLSNLLHFSEWQLFSKPLVFFDNSIFDGNIFIFSLVIIQCQVQSRNHHPAIVNPTKFILSYHANQKPNKPYQSENQIEFHVFFCVAYFHLKESINPKDIKIFGVDSTVETNYLSYSASKIIGKV